MASGRQSLLYRAGVVIGAGGLSNPYCSNSQSDAQLVAAGDEDDDDGGGRGRFYGENAGSEDEMLLVERWQRFETLVT